MMMYGVHTTHTCSTCTPHDHRCDEQSQSWPWLTTYITSLFFVLPLTTTFKVSNCSYGLRLSSFDMPTDLFSVLVVPFLTFVVYFAVSVKHIQCLSINSCFVTLAMIETVRHSGDRVVYRYYRCVWCAPPHIIILWCKMVFWAFGLYFGTTSGFGARFLILGYFHVWCKKHVLPLACIFSNDFLC